MQLFLHLFHKFCENHYPSLCQKEEEGSFFFGMSRGSLTCWQMLAAQRHNENDIFNHMMENRIDVIKHENEINAHLNITNEEINYEDIKEILSDLKTLGLGFIYPTLPLYLVEDDIKKTNIPYIFVFPEDDTYTPSHTVIQAIPEHKRKSSCIFISDAGHGFDTCMMNNGKKFMSAILSYLHPWINEKYLEIQGVERLAGKRNSSLRWLDSLIVAPMHLSHNEAMLDIEEEKNKYKSNNLIFANIEKIKSYTYSFSRHFFKRMLPNHPERCRGGVLKVEKWDKIIPVKEVGDLDDYFEKNITEKLYKDYITIKIAENETIKMYFDQCIIPFLEGKEIERHYI